MEPCPAWPEARSTAHSLYACFAFGLPSFALSLALGIASGVTYLLLLPATCFFGSFLAIGGCLGGLITVGASNT